MEKINKKNIGAMWSRTSREGANYLNISLDLEPIANKLKEGGDTIKLIAFENSYKEKENQPDWKVRFWEPKENNQYTHKKEVNETQLDAKLEDAVSDIPF